MKIGIVGSREYKNFQKIYDLLATFPKDTVIVSGGARGVDSYAEKAAIRLGLATPLIFHPDWNDITHPEAIIKINQFGKNYDAKAGIRRNKMIVENSDLIYAFWDGKSSGTRSTIEIARKMGKEVIIISD